jgi:hypothetical protein
VTFVSVEARQFLRAARDGRVYRTTGGIVMQRGDKHGGQNRRATGAHRQAVANGWITAEPDADRIYRLTPDGEAALAAREAGVP